jgi:hypothetical protein
VDNPYGHPSAWTLGLLRAMGATTFRTDKDGAVAVLRRGGVLTVVPRRGPSAADRLAAGGGSHWARAVPVGDSASASHDHGGTSTVLTAGRRGARPDDRATSAWAPAVSGVERDTAGSAGAARSGQVSTGRRAPSVPAAAAPVPLVPAGLPPAPIGDLSVAPRRRARRPGVTCSTSCRRPPRRRRSPS